MKNRLNIIKTQRDSFGLTERQVEKAKEFAALSDIEQFVTTQKERQKELIAEQEELIDSTIERSEKLLTIDKERLSVYKQINEERAQESEYIWRSLIKV